MPKIYFKLKANKLKKSLKLLVVPVRLAYNIKIGLKYILKTKVQPKGYLELENMAIYIFILSLKKIKA